MLDILLAAAFAAIIVGVCAAQRTTPADIGRHLAAYPGTLFVGCATGAFVAVGVWALSMPLGEQPAHRLALFAAAWAALYTVLEVGDMAVPRTRDDVGTGHREQQISSGWPPGS